MTTDDMDLSGLYAEGTRFYTLPSGEQVVVDNNNMIEAQIVIGLEDAVDNDLEGFLDLVSERVVGSCLLMGFSYRVTGLTPEGALILTVNGDISEVLAEEKDNG